MIKSRHGSKKRIKAAKTAKVAKTSVMRLKKKNATLKSDEESSVISSDLKPLKKRKSKPKRVDYNAKANFDKYDDKPLKRDLQVKLAKKSISETIKNIEDAYVTPTIVSKVKIDHHERD